MKIGLIDVDGHNFPNLALMKLSAWHKRKGENVEWWNGLKHYDVVYKSKVFDDTYTKDMEHCVNADRIVEGGTGYGLEEKMLEQLNMGGLSKIEVSIKRLQMFEPGGGGLLFSLQRRKRQRCHQSLGGHGRGQIRRALQRHKRGPAGACEFY